MVLNSMNGRAEIPGQAKVVIIGGGWGYTVKTNIGFGYVRRAEGVDKDFPQAGHYELEIASERCPCELQLQPLYDPKMLKLKS